MTRLIGLLGGTFDPVHLGHLQAACTVADAVPLDEVRLVPCRQPAHREAPAAGVEQRVALLKLALPAFPQLALESCELEREGPSYAVDTLEVLHAREPDAAWLWLMGVDAFQSFTGWRQWRRILSLAHLVVMTRPGYRCEGEARELLQRHQVGPDYEPLGRQKAGGIILLDVASPAISSTDIRRRLREGQTVKGLVPAAVADYLESQPVYS